MFGYPSGSAAALLGGKLPLRYCSGSFACRVPTWWLPARGHVHGLISEFAGIGEVSRARLSSLHRKTPAHLAGFGRGWEFSVSADRLEEIEG